MYDADVIEFGSHVLILMHTYSLQIETEVSSKIVFIYVPLSLTSSQDVKSFLNTDLTPLDAKQQTFLLLRD